MTLLTVLGPRSLCHGDRQTTELVLLWCRLLSFSVFQHTWRVAGRGEAEYRY